MSLLAGEHEARALEIGLDTSGSIRWSFSTVARVSPLGFATWSMMPTIAARLHRRVDRLEARVGSMRGMPYFALCQ